MTVPSRSQPTTELDQHINWIRGFLETMTADNWADNKLHIERQMDSVVEHIATLKARGAELEGALRAIDTHLDNFGYLKNMKARKIALRALSHAGPVARDTADK